MHHQKGSITVTYTADWNLREGEYRRKLGECLKSTESHTVVHHKWWRLIHGELVRLDSTEWRFMYISGEKKLDTIWKELTEEFEEELQ
jgi:hypothetical protein